MAAVPEKLSAILTKGVGRGGETGNEAELIGDSTRDTQEVRVYCTIFFTKFNLQGVPRLIWPCPRVDRPV